MSGMAVSLGYSVVGPVLPQISAELAHGPRDAYLVKLVLGIIGAATIIGAPAAGYLSDWLGRRWILTFAALFYAVAGCAPIFLTDLAAILVSRACLGLAASAIATLGIAMVGDHFEDQRRSQWIGVVVAVAMLGNIAFTPIAGFLGELGWRTPFYIYLIGIPLGVFACFGSGRDPAVPQHRSKNGHVVPQRRRHIPVKLMVEAAMTGGIIYVPAIYLPFRLREVGFSGPSQIGLLLTLEALFGAMVALSYGRARKFLSHGAAFLVSFGCVAVGMSLIALNTSNVGIFTGLVVWGLGLGWLSPNILAYASSYGDGLDRGRVLGLAKASLSIAPIIGISLLEPVSIRHGAGGVLLVATALALIMFCWAVTQEMTSKPRVKVMLRK